jgi:hypothetical protein
LGDYYAKFKIVVQLQKQQSMTKKSSRGRIPKVLGESFLEPDGSVLVGVLSQEEKKRKKAEKKAKVVANKGAC